MTKKEELIQAIRFMPVDKMLKSLEILDDGVSNNMSFYCSQEKLLMIINDFFDDNLHGCVPTGYPTTIHGWEFVEMPTN